MQEVYGTVSGGEGVCSALYLEVSECTRHCSIADPPPARCDVDRGNRLSEESHAGLREMLSRISRLQL